MTMMKLLSLVQAKEWFQFIQLKKHFGKEKV